MLCRTTVRISGVMKQLRVAVIGAGAAGLCALKHLADRPSVFSPVGFEQTATIGGTWVYTDEVGTDQFGLPVHSSMYKNLRTNLPKEVMAFPDFPFQTDLPSFLTHQQVLQYLHDYASNFSLNKFIKFSTAVEGVRPVAGNPVMWEVTYKDVRDQTAPTHTESFDAVMVCNGHYSVPLVPDIPGAAEFTGLVMHSHEYRDPEVFRNRRVVCLGAGSSGQDIALELSTVAKQVLLSHNKQPLQSTLPENFVQVPGIERLTKSSAILNNGSEVEEVDAVMYCTGYHFSFPFLAQECAVTTDDERIRPLYKHLIHTEFPSLSFIGICKIIAPFPQFYCQVLFALSVLDGSLKLPPKKEMDEDTERDFRSRLDNGLLPRYAHHMGTRQFNYNNDLAKIANFECVPQVVEELYNEVHNTRSSNLTGYKKAEYKVTGPTSFTVIKQ